MFKELDEIDEILAEANDGPEKAPESPARPSRRPGGGDRYHWVARGAEVVEVREDSLSDDEYAEITDWDSRGRSQEPSLSETPILVSVYEFEAKLRNLLAGGHGYVPTGVRAAGDVYRGLYRSYSKSHGFAGSCVASDTMPIWFALRDLPVVGRVRIFVDRMLPTGRIHVKWRKK